MGGLRKVVKPGPSGRSATGNQSVADSASDLIFRVMESYDEAISVLGNCVCGVGSCAGRADADATRQAAPHRPLSADATRPPPAQVAPAQTPPTQTAPAQPAQ